MSNLGSQSSIIIFFLFQITPVDYEFGTGKMTQTSILGAENVYVYPVSATLFVILNLLKCW